MNINNQKQGINDEAKGLSNVEILKLLNDTFGTNYTSSSSWDIMEALRTEWKKGLGKSMLEGDSMLACSDYSDGKCLDSGKYCDGCASDFELNNTIQCPECGKPNTEETTSKGYYPSDYRYCDCGCPIEFK